MKKIFQMCLIVVICLFIGLGLFGCRDNIEIEVYMPDGAPALSMAKLMYEDKEFGYDFDYNVVSASNISNYILQRKADIAILPINAASKILKNGENYKVLATVTNGNLYIVGNRDIDSLDDLTGEVVGVIGQGNVPDLNLKYLLNNSGIEYVAGEQLIEGKVALRYFSDASNLIPMLKQGKLSFGLLPEPAVSKLLSMSDNFSIELDIQKLWDGGTYPQAVLVAKNSICEKSNLINGIITAMKENENWVLSNPSLAVSAVNDNLEDGVVSSLQTGLSSNAIVNCNIKIRTTADSGEIERMKSYLEKIRSVDGSAIGSYTDNLFYII